VHRRYAAGRFPKVRPRVHARGFTLIEVVVAITLLSLIVVALFSGIHLSTTAWRKASGPLEAELDRHAVASLVRRQLAQLHAVYAQVEGREQTLFVGGPDRIRFVSPLPAHRGVAGLHVVEFRATDRGALEIGYELYRPDRHVPLDAVELGVSETLLDETGEVGFAYGVHDGNGGVEWLDSWTRSDTYPDLVAVTGPGLEPWSFGIKARDSRFRVVDPIAGGGGPRGGDDTGGDTSGERGADPGTEAVPNPTPQATPQAGRGRSTQTPKPGSEFAAPNPGRYSLGKVSPPPTGIQTFTREPDGVGERGDPRCGTELQC